MTIGKLFVISAPSGTGKTTLLKEVMAGLPKMAFSVSHTTRDPRPGEKDGVDYHFVTREEFDSMIERGLFIEYAEVHNNLYGTSSAAIEKQLRAGLDVILDIDVQGASILRKSNRIQAVHIFIAPPALDELEKRLRGRGTESEEKIQLRLKNAKDEIAAAPEYEYLMINDDFDDASRVLAGIVVAERARGHRLATGESIKLA